VRRPYLSLWGLHFFGLTQEYRLSLFTEIHEIVFHGKGGYDWETIYNMPIWLRKFTFNKIKEFYEPENNKDAQSQMENKEALAKLNIPPTYSTKATKK
jgi:hypothetical protein